MDKSQYQILRWSVECHVANHISDPVAARDFCNELMRQFVQVMAASQAARASGKRDLLTFRRDRKSNPPSWAFRKPGTDSRLPKL